MIKIIIKLLLAGILIGCIFKVPYGYFQFVRIAGCIGFCWLAYIEHEEKKSITAILSIVCAILLNPIFKIHFARKTWNNIDISIAVFLGLWVIFDLRYLYLNRK